MIPIEGLRALEQMTQKVVTEDIPGDIVECGVCNGGSAAVLAQLLKKSFDRQLWLFDSFQGLPVPVAADGPSAPEVVGRLVGSEDTVRRVLKQTGVPMERVHIAAGWFHETFLHVQIDRIAFLHIDADFYESILLTLERFYDAVAPGGFVVLDDYYDWPGCKAALEEFAARRELTLKLLQGPPAHFRKEQP
jgi:O-methyltransferase